MTSEGRSYEILIVEDNPADIRLTGELLKEGPTPKIVHSVVNAAEALAYLRRQGVYANRRKPDLVFLTLNLPKKDGRDLLSEIKQDPNLKRIPVIIFTSSASSDDVQHTYDLHANCYVYKPVDLKEYTELIRSLEEFWLRTVQLPPD